MKGKILLLCAMIAAQLFVPVSMIVQRERVLHNGAVYKFKTVPVDPYDVMRGRYVSLQVEQAQFDLADTAQFDIGQRVYAVLAQDQHGYAQVIDVTTQPPENADYVSAGIRWKNGGFIMLDLPFDRYYVNEHKAPQAEQLYRKHTALPDSSTYITVRVLRGRAVLEELYIDNRPLPSYFEK